MHKAGFVLRRSFHAFGVLAVTLAAAAPAWVRADELPKAEAILDRFVEVTGGKDAYEKLRNRVSHGTVEVPSAQVKGSIAIYHQAPNLLYIEQDLGQFGKSREGFDGRTAWQHSPMGARIKEGEERAAAERSAKFNAEYKWRETYKDAETLAMEDLDGKPAFKVRVTPRQGAEEVRYFEKESGLMVKMTTSVTTAMGEIPLEIYYSDYRESAGVKVPYKIVQKAAMQEVVLTIEKTEHNVEIPDERFRMPDAVREMLGDEEQP